MRRGQTLFPLTHETMRAASLKRAAAFVATVAVGGAAAFAVVAGCSKDSEAAPALASVQSAVAPAASPTAGPHVDGKNFKLDGSAPGECKAGAECTVTLRLEAHGDYHINQQYPYKFVAAGAAGVEFLGADAAKGTFSKAAGDFKLEGEKAGIMSVRFKPAAKGNVSIAGTFKMSVCSAKDCQIEVQEISVPVSVK